MANFSQKNTSSSELVFSISFKAAYQFAAGCSAVTSLGAALGASFGA